MFNVLFLRNSSKQCLWCPLTQPGACRQVQGEQATARQALDLSLPSALSATALQETSIVLLPYVNHQNLQSQYHLVWICSVIAIMAGHQSLRSAGAAEVCKALPAIFEPQERPSSAGPFQR